MYQLGTDEVSSRFPESCCRELSLFGALSDPCIHFLLQHGRVLHFNANEVLFRLDEEPECFFIILSGQVEYYRYPGGSKTYIKSYIPGEQVGYISMIGLHKRLGDTISHEQSIALEISSELFYQVCEKFSNDFVIFLINMTRDMSRKITDLDSICAELSVKSQAD